MQTKHSSRFVTVIITCYNHGEYLSHAIESVLKQTHHSFEIIVVDDGSLDNTKEIAGFYPVVLYIYQQNQGLSAARNTGIKYSKGRFLVFLDADDWLVPNALEKNIQYLQKDRKLAFVSGGHIKVNNNGHILENVNVCIEINHYEHLLQGNYIGMHATVMYQRWVFDKFQFDVSLSACEDYDLYLNIARNYPIFHHQEVIAFYRIHGVNMSGNLPLMLETVLAVLKRQKSQLRNDTERECFKNGIVIWKRYYGERLYKALLDKRFSTVLSSRKDLAVLSKYAKILYLKMWILLLLKSIKKVLRHFIKGKSKFPIQKLDFGDFQRTEPFSTQFGYDRGGPVDRYYIEDFLQRNEEFVKGEILEVGDNGYTLRYGGDKVKRSDILHIDENNPKATYVGDLSNIPDLPSNQFDCLILTQTLHLIYHFDKALQTCYRVLKPGGVLLITVPGISHIDQGEWKETWLWSFTGASVKKMLIEIFPVTAITVQTFGNVLVATAFLYGLGLPEIKKEHLDFHDPHYQVIITAKAVKPV